MNINSLNINSLNEITLILTENCNLECKYCDQGHSNKNQNINNIKEFFNNINLKELNKNLNIELFGGEPFLEKKLIIEIIEFLRRTLTGPQRQLITFKINTNGSIWNESYFEIFKLMKEYNFRIPNFIISYDGLWQSERSNELLTKIIEKNIESIFNIDCLSAITKISFSYNGSNQDLLKNYLFISEKFNINISNIKHYLIREPWKWNDIKFNKYQIDFKNYLKYDLLYYRKFGLHLRYIQDKILEFTEPRFGCGFGKTRITLAGNQILNCGLDNDFSNDMQITDNQIKNNCIDCEIYNHCNKICPKKIFYSKEINYNCEIKKMEFNILKNYFKKYDPETYEIIFKNEK